MPDEKRGYFISQLENIRKNPNIFFRKTSWLTKWDCDVIFSLQSTKPSVVINKQNDLFSIWLGHTKSILLSSGLLFLRTDSEQIIDPIYHMSPDLEYTSHLNNHEIRESLCRHAIQTFATESKPYSLSPDRLSYPGLGIVQGFLMSSRSCDKPCLSSYGSNIAQTVRN